jgi:hypothetical protein
MSQLGRTDAERAIATLIETYRRGFLRRDPADRVYLGRQS